MDGGIQSIVRDDLVILPRGRKVAMIDAGCHGDDGVAKCLRHSKFRHRPGRLQSLRRNEEQHGVGRTNSFAQVRSPARACGNLPKAHWFEAYFAEPPGDVADQLFLPNMADENLASGFRHGLLLLASGQLGQLPAVTGELVQVELFPTELHWLAHPFYSITLRFPKRSANPQANFQIAQLA
jgi:hypothetical protein